MATRTWSNKGAHWSSHKYDCLSRDHKDYIGEYRIWNSMRRRCNSPSCGMYKSYGARGIKVCDRWEGDNGFINFYNDMGKRPVDKNGNHYQIDRIDVNGNYCPENCRWVPSVVNARNKQNSVKIWFMGDEYGISELCKLFGLKRTTVTESVRLRGVKLEDAFTKVFINKYGGKLCQQ